MQTEKNKTEDFEKCSRCGIMIEDGKGRFRKEETSYCLGCYDSGRSANAKKEMKDQCQNDSRRLQMAGSN